MRKYSNASQAGRLRKQRKAEQLSPRDRQILAFLSLPCRTHWSDGSTSEGPLMQELPKDDEAWERYRENKRNGKPYPVKYEPILPEDMSQHSSIFPSMNVKADVDLLTTLCEKCTEGLPILLGQSEG